MIADTGLKTEKHNNEIQPGPEIDKIFRQLNKHHYPSETNFILFFRGQAWWHTPSFPALQGQR